MDNQWTMNCVIFGAELFKLLYQGKISKADAIAKVQNLTPELSGMEAGYLLKRIQDLVVSV